MKKSFTITLHFDIDADELTRSHRMIVHGSLIGMDLRCTNIAAFKNFISDESIYNSDSEVINHAIRDTSRDVIRHLIQETHAGTQLMQT